MATPYQLLYRIGFIPWDGKTERSPLDVLLDRLPAGTALDIGCGTGHHSVRLAQHGWDVLGVDIVQPALDAARERATEAGVKLELLRANVGGLGKQLDGRTFDLVVDIGCLHGLSAAKRREAYASIGRLTAPGSTLLQLAVLPRRGLGPHGFDEAMLLDEIGPEWRVESVQQQEALERRSPLGSSPFQWYVLRRGEGR